MADLQPQTVLIMLPSQEEEDQESLVLFNLQGITVHQVREFSESRCRCVGSSHGWLVILDETANPYLFNPFSQASIQLPTKDTFPHILYVSEKTVGHDDFVVDYNYGSSYVRTRMSARQLQYILVSKAILNADPSSSSSGAVNNNNYSVIVFVIYSPESKLAFCKQGDDEWKTQLNAIYPPYADIISYKNQLFALSDSGLIEVWDFHSNSPVKTMEIQPSFPSKIVETSRSLGDLYSSRWYLVESSGKLLLVARYVGEFVGDDDTPVYEADLLPDENTQPLICPYKTLQFQVCELNFVRKEWMEVESLSDRVLFLGGNHSMSLSAMDYPECKKNSIYFTDDYWERMNEDYSYGGHDLGVFNLGDGNVKPLFEFDTLKIEPPPLLVVPTPVHCRK